MQTALQNPHYKKIWEKVMMNRQPETKSLEQALKMEATEDYCLFYNEEKAFYGMNKPDVLTRFEISEEHLDADFLYEDDRDIQDYQCAENFITLGRPITLEDVLMLFGKIFNKTLNGSKFVQLTCEGAFITMQPSEHPLHRIEVILGKPLHEQTPETWEQISNLIN